MERSIKPIYGTLKIIGVLFVLICGIVVYELNRGSNLTPEQRRAINERGQRASAAVEAETLRSQAREICWSGLLRTLHDPYSAKRDDSVWPVIDNGGKYIKGDIFTVTMTGRAKNIYGAYMLQRWKCEARIEGDQWRVVSIQPAN